MDPLTQGLLGAGAAQGTLPDRPFSTERVAWDFIALIDPLLTLPLPAAVGLVPAPTYIGMGELQNYRGSAAQRELAAA